MNLNGIFNLKLLWDDIYQLLNKNIEKKTFNRWKILFFSKFALKVNRLLNSTNLEYFRK